MALKYLPLNALLLKGPKIKPMFLPFEDSDIPGVKKILYKKYAASNACGVHGGGRWIRTTPAIYQA